MASPQKENGFTSICNELMDVLSKAKLNGTQFRIVNCILRYTYGFQRKEHEFSLTFLSEATNTHKDQIKRELLELINKKIIFVIKEAGFTSSRVLSLNKNYEEWENVLESTQGAKKPTVYEIAYPQGANSHTPQGAKKPTKKESIKENNKETYEQVENIWLLYPNKKGKSNAINKIPKLIKEFGYEQMERCVERYTAEIEAKKIQQQYIKHGSTFFNSGYVDYLDGNYEQLEETSADKKNWWDDIDS